MKKLFLSAALMLALAANAQTEKTATSNPAEPVTAEATAVTEQSKEYKAIEQSEIKAEVLSPAVKKYQGYALVEALMATDGSEYKLVLRKDDKDIAVFYKSNGEFIKEETV